MKKEIEPILTEKEINTVFIISKLTKRNNKKERPLRKKNEHVILTRPREKESDDENSSEEMQ